MHPSLEETWGELSEPATAEIRLLFGTLDPRRLQPFTEDGVLEVFPGLAELMAAVAAAMPAGTFVNIDYGEWFPGVVQTEDGERWGLEGRARRRRTIRGYFKHQMVLEALARPGKQDLTADVDFAAVDLHGRLAGFETVLFTTLAALLRGGGAEAELEALRQAGTVPAETRGPASGSSTPCPSGSDVDPLEADRQATVLRNLLDERDLGGAFKVILQVRD